MMLLAQQVERPESLTGFPVWVDLLLVGGLILFAFLLVWYAKRK